jgi:hypothetical protein
MFESLLGAVRFFPNFCKFRPPGVHELGKTQPLLGAKYDWHGVTTPTTFELGLVKDQRESSRLIYSTEGADRGNAEN